MTLAVLDRMQRDGTDHVLLDMRDLSEARFPNVFEALRAAGHDPARAPVPVSPASHYVMGGVATDLDGRSSLPGLFAVGECACTGLHGANRLASNSLTECFVLGARAASAAVAEPEAISTPEPPSWRFDPPPAETRDAVWRLAGPLRRTDQLELLLEDPYPLARLIARFALERTESRGSHRRLEHPERDPEPIAATCFAGATSFAGRPGRRRGRPAHPTFGYLIRGRRAYLKVLNALNSTYF